MQFYVCIKHNYWHIQKENGKTAGNTGCQEIQLCMEKCFRIGRLTCFDILFIQWSIWCNYILQTTRPFLWFEYYYMISLWTVKKQAEVILYKYKIYIKPKPPPDLQRNIQSTVCQTWHANSNCQQHGSQQLLQVTVSAKRGGTSWEPFECWWGIWPWWPLNASMSSMDKYWSYVKTSYLGIHWNWLFYHLNKKCTQTYEQWLHDAWTHKQNIMK